MLLKCILASSLKVKIFINRPHSQEVMGRIKTVLIKRQTKELLRKYGDKFTSDFGQNKVLVTQYMKIPSKKLRNIVAGYVTRLKKKGVYIGM